MSALYRIVFLTLLLAVSVPAAQRLPRFVDVAAETGLTLRNVSGGLAKDYIVEATGNGAGFLDYDKDGDLDILLTNGSTLQRQSEGGDAMVALYQNNDGHFTDVTEDAALSSRGWGAGVCAADYDNDGNRDFYVTAYGPNVLYRNNGDGTFDDVTRRAGTGDSHWSTNCAFGDYDRDGDVDLYVANYLTFAKDDVPKPGEFGSCHYMGVDVFCGPTGLPGEADTLYQNNGDGTFTDVTAAAGIEDPGYYGFGVTFSDLDNDGWLDIYVANDSRPNFLFRNNRDGTFSEVGLISGTSVNNQGKSQAGMGLAVGDYDGDGYFDIFVTNFIDDTNTLYHNLGDLNFEEATRVVGTGSESLGHMGWGADFADLDNDGRLDLFVANGHILPMIEKQRTGQRYRQPKEIYRNTGHGSFEEVTEAIGGDLLTGRSARGLAVGDYDNDGDLDALTVNMDDLPNLYRNDSGNRNHWIGFRLEGVRSNRDGIGARIEIKLGGRTRVAEVRSGGSYLSQNDMRVHFGLGQQTQVDSIRIRWPNGNIESVVPMGIDQIITVREGEGIVARAGPPPPPAALKRRCAC